MNAAGVLVGFRVTVPALPMPAGDKTDKDRKVIKTKSKTDALRWGQQRRAVLTEEYHARRRGELEAKKPKSKVPTFTFHAPEWVKALKGDPTKKPSSIDAIESVLRIHLLPFVSNLRLDECTNRVYADLRAKWTEGGYQYVDQFGRPRWVKGTKAQTTHNNRSTVLRSMLVTAVEWGVIPVLPCTIKIPSVKPEEADFYEPKVLNVMLEAAAEHDLRVYVSLLLGADAGFRRNEILAIQWPDVDFKAKEINVCRNVYHRKDERIETTPKGGVSMRVPCTPRLLAALRKLHERRTGATVLADNDGQPWTPKVLRRAVAAIERVVGLTDTGRIHIFRHSFASNLCAAGAAPIVVQRLGRWSDLRVMQRYAHLHEGALREGIDLLAKHGTPNA
jgi:integrase